MPLLFCNNVVVYFVRGQIHGFKVVGLDIQCRCIEFSLCSARRSILHPWGPQTCRRFCDSACTSSFHPQPRPHRFPFLSAQSSKSSSFQICRIFSFEISDSLGPEALTGPRYLMHCCCSFDLGHWSSISTSFPSPISNLLKHYLRELLTSFLHLVWI